MPVEYERDRVAIGTQDDVVEVAGADKGDRAAGGLSSASAAVTYFSGDVDA